MLKEAKQLLINKETAKLFPKKTMMRKVIKQDFSCPCGEECEGAYIDAYNHGKNWYWWTKDNRLCTSKIAKAKYNIGDILWIKESKNFTKEMVRYFIKITNIQIERLWDITKHNDNYYKEGIVELAKEDIKQCNGEIYCINKCLENYFKKMWNKTAPKGYKWEDNPFVFVYEWEYLEKD